MSVLQQSTATGITGPPLRTRCRVARAPFKPRHADCHASRRSMAGSRTTHCSFCCPPTPLSAGQVQQIDAIFTSPGLPDLADLDTWTLILTCDHVVERTQHSSNRSWSRSVEDRPTCDCTRGVVKTERVLDGHVQHAAGHHRAATDNLGSADQQGVDCDS
jgi:hypothetical protein